MPKVYNKRDKDIPKDAIYVGRPTKWGNPYPIGREFTRKQTVELYYHWLTKNEKSPIKDIEELRGKDLVCWCSPKPCHADILLQMANFDENLWKEIINGPKDTKRN